jgi:hypothetical protein
VTLTWCFTAKGVGDDPPMAVKLIYQMLATLPSWTALHVRSATANDIESSCCAINWPCCSDAHHDRRSAEATAP